MSVESEGIGGLILVLVLIYMYFVTFSNCGNGLCYLPNQSHVFERIALPTYPATVSSLFFVEF